MTETFAVGDLVEAVKGESVVRGRVKLGTKVAGCASYRYIGDSASLDEVYLKRGWTVTVIEKALPPLPTETGLYLDIDGDLWRVANDVGLVSLESKIHDWESAARYAPFTRLAPVAEVLGKVREGVGSYKALLDLTDDIAADYGVEL